MPHRQRKSVAEAGGKIARGKTIKRETIWGSIFGIAGIAGRQDNLNIAASRNVISGEGDPTFKVPVADGREVEMVSLRLLIEA